GLLHDVPVVARLDAILVHRAFAQAGDETLPDARTRARIHRRGGVIPAVEVAHHRHPPGRGRPHGEGDAGFAMAAGEVRAELLVQAEVRALVEQIDVVIAQVRGVIGAGAGSAAGAD